MSTKNVQDEQLELTPRQVAQAIGMSESSLKRWCDSGAIPTRRTVGGHRRLPVAGVMRFLREKQFELKQPTLLGLPAGLKNPKLEPEALKSQLLDHLMEGDSDAVSRLGVETLLASPSLPTMFDDVLAPVLYELGRLWHRGELEVFRERSAITMVRRLLHELRRLIVLPEPAAPLAIGATLEGDHYEVAVHMGELVLADVGWRAVAIGSNLPTTTVADAFDRMKPSLLWLSLSHVVEVEDFVTGYSALYDRAMELGIAVTVGGAALTPPLRSRIRATAFGSSMRELAELGRGLLPRVASSSP